MNYTDEEILKIRNDAYKEGENHSLPSPKTINLIDKMEKAIKKFGEKLEEINGSLIENNLNTKNLLEEQKDQRIVLQNHDKKISNIYVGLTMANVVVPLICGLLLYIYAGDMMTEEKVEKIVQESMQEPLTEHEIQEMITVEISKYLTID